MSDELLGQIDRLIQSRPMYREALSVYRDLMSLVDETEPEITYELKDDSIRDIKAKEGFPLFSRRDLPIDFESIYPVFFRLLEHLSSTKRSDSEALKRASKRAQHDPDWVRRLIAAFLSDDERSFTKLAKAEALAPMVLKFTTHIALRPSLRSLRESAKEVIQKGSWNYGYCPLCGSSPDISCLDGEGKRFLHCELCGHEWYYPRLRCPFCENKESNELGYFTSEQEEGYRVDFCKKCNRYIKTLDKRVIESPAPLEFENLSTLHLDMLAHQQGFKSPGRP
jgi:FdhE protein